MTQAAFPKLLSSQIAFDIARTILDGFDKHYRLFRQTSQTAKRHFETGAWAVAQQAARERIGFYDQRVQECVQALEDEYASEELTDAVWRERAPLHRHAVRPQAAGAGRDLLQFGVLQHIAPHVLP
jgi:isocitrate dehydrogenase kinase/phosphatase